MRYLSHALPNRRYGEQHFGRINQTPDVTAGNPVIAQGGPRKHELHDQVHLLMVDGMGLLGESAYGRLPF